MAHLKNQFIPENSNRVEEAILLYAEQDAKLKINNPALARNDAYDIELKLNQYRSIVIEFRKSKNPQEKQALKYIRHEIRKLDAKLKPTWFNRFFYSDLIEEIKGRIRSENDPVNYYQRATGNLQKELLRQHNLKNLSAELKKAGFTFEMEGSLKRMIGLNLPEFHLRYADIENPDAHYVVHFKKIPKTDLYYFEKFDAIARPSLDALLNNDPSSCRQTFYVNDELKINAKEAANLVNGKGVCRFLDGEDRWLMLDSETNQLIDVPFNLEEKLSSLPIKEREDVNKYQAIIDAIKRGGKKEVTLTINDKPVKYTIQAAPSQDTVYVFDKSNRLVDLGLMVNVQQSTKSLVQQIYDDELSRPQRQGLHV
jgi:hypothetical protein